MLFSKMQIGVCHLLWQYQSIMCHSAGFTQGFEALFSEHFAECIWGINGAINNYMGDVQAFGAELGTE